MRDVLQLGARAVLGGYLSAHAAQKVGGLFGGPGLETTAQGFDYLGLTPGREMAVLASGCELVGGLLTVTGLAHPAGPVTVMGTMAVAAATHRGRGAFQADGGYELAVTNLALAGVLAVSHPGRARLGPSARPGLVAAGSVGGAVLAGFFVSRIRDAQNRIVESQGHAPGR